MLAWTSGKNSWCCKTSVWNWQLGRQLSLGVVSFSDWLVVPSTTLCNDVSWWRWCKPNNSCSKSVPIKFISEDSACVSYFVVEELLIMDLGSRKHEDRITTPPASNTYLSTKANSQPHLFHNPRTSQDPPLQSLNLSTTIRIKKSTNVKIKTNKWKLMGIKYA